MSSKQNNLTTQLLFLRALMSAGLFLALSAGGLVAACGRPPPAEWPGFHALRQSTPQPARQVMGVPVSETDYRLALRWGSEWFRSETFGGERAVTDIAGVLGAEVEVPCDEAEASRSKDCYRLESVKLYFARAIDELDGVQGNLYQGNGGPEGTGYTRDLVLEFPAGTRLHGLPVPERMHTGLDVEAGEAWPIGIQAVPAPPEEAALPYLWDLDQLGVGPAPAAASKVRIGITCALCHFSLDVDWDDQLDLRSARMERPTPGSRTVPEHSWSVGNQDLSLAWLFGTSANPLLGFAVFSGPVGKNSAEASVKWARWVKQNYKIAPRLVKQEVLRGILIQPRGYADVTSNARHDATQFPPLFMSHNWPSNSDGAVLNSLDRNNVVWTSTLDFTVLVGLTADRGGSAASLLYWEEPSVYSEFTAEEFAELVVHLSPAVRADPSQRQPLIDDILGRSDGVPGLLDPDSVYVMPGPDGVMPDGILNHPENKKHGRIRFPKDLGGDAPLRGATTGLLGLRAHLRPALRQDPEIRAFLERNPKIRADDLMGAAVDAMLEWQPSPPNVSEQVVRARELLPRGYEVFREAGCASCHRGPFYTDNRVHRVFDRRQRQVGIAAPSTAGWRSLGRGSGPAIGTSATRALDSRLLTSFVAPDYDPRTGKPTREGSPLGGLFGDGRTVGYKPTQLRYIWGSAPYLHDGSIGVAVRPGVSVDRDNLQQLLRLGPKQKLYGMAHIFNEQRRDPAAHFRADAALSLQALVLASERERIREECQRSILPVPGAGQTENPLLVPDTIALEHLGIEGIGHEFFIDDEPGGTDVSALVAFLLAIDDSPGKLPEKGEN